MKTTCIFLFVLLTAMLAHGQSKSFTNTTLVVKFTTHQSQKSATQNTIDAIKLAVGDDLIEIQPAFEQHYTKKNGLIASNNLSRIFKIELKTDKNFNRYINEIGRFENIEYIEPYPVARVFDAPNDPFIASQYYLNKIKAFEAFNFSQGDTNIVIGIVDSGCDLLHDDLKANYKYNYDDPVNGKDDDEDGYIDNYYGWDVADNDFSPQNLVNSNGDINYHGTNVAGLASAVTNNGLGVASIGCKTKILPIKAMNASGYIVAGYEGIIYAADHGCQIINCSWGSNTPSKFAQDVINYATIERGCLVVAAAGNTAASVDKRPYTWFYPASYQNVLSVAATGPSDVRWSGSSYATTVDVSAPGEGIYTTQQFNNYRWGSGTSFASPQVAGLAGLLKAIRPELTARQLSEQIRITADIIDTLSENVYYSRQMGYGRINALRALTTTNMPAIRLDSVSIQSTKKSSLVAGDTLQVSFIATNYLAQVTNTTLRLTSNSEYIVPVKNIFKTGALNTYESVNNLNQPLLMEVKKDMPFNEKIWFIFEIKDEGYDDYQIVEQRINENYITITENYLTTTLTSNGTIGFADSAKNLGVGLIYNHDYNLLNYGGITLATSNSAMATSILDTSNFSTVLLVDTLRNSDGILVGNTTYATTQKTGLSLIVSQTTQASLPTATEPMLTYYYNIKNTGNLTVEDAKLSQFMDWNIYSSTQNQVGFVNELNLSYTYSNTNDVLYAGICLLNDMKSVPYAFDLIAGGNNGIDITNGFNNTFKWFTMNNPRLAAGNNGDSIDVASMLTTDFFTIPANDSVEIAFAHIVSKNYYDMVNEAIKARDNYQHTAISNNINAPFKIYPNPANSTINITGNEIHDKVTVVIYDNNGRQQLKQTMLNSKNITIDISKLDAGIYLVNYVSSNEVKTAKFIKTP